MASLFADNTMLFSESGRMLQRIVDEFHLVNKRKLKLNVGKSKVMIFVRAREQSIEFAKPYRIIAESTTEC